MVNQLKNLESPESALYKKAYYLLEVRYNISSQFFIYLDNGEKY